jgi:L-asparaginase
MKRCALVTTGGTIVSRIDKATGLAVPAWSGEELLSTLQGMTDTSRIEIHDFIRVASPQIEMVHWVGLHAKIQALVDRDDIKGVVVTHGTGTLEETAWFLDLTLQTDKPVVVTGAQRNASEPDFDGSRNLLNAFRICESENARAMGVLVALNDHINAAREVAKTHTLDVETFQSGEWGYLGAVLKDQVIFRRRPFGRLHIALTSTTLPNVEIVSMYAGASGAMVRAAADSGARGLVVQGIATGHVNAAMYEAIVEVLNQGIPVVIASRILKGGTRMAYGFTGSTHHLVEAGAVLSGDLSPWKARILLMLALQDDAGERRSSIRSLTELFASPDTFPLQGL